MSTREAQHESIAIIGLAGRFPGARDLDEFWRNLCAGVESVTFFSEEELQPSLLDGPVPRGAPNLVKARAVLDRPEWFDAAFFGINPREGELLDPQQRIFLECAWEALEHAGCNPDECEGAIGVFAGAGLNTYLLSNIVTRPDVLRLAGGFQAMLANDKDFLPTRVSYKLNLRGPSVSVQTACSTSLVAVCLACQNLLNFSCDVALAGGVSVSFPQKRGALFHEGSILAPDGHCRPFDAAAAGTVSGDGAGVVALKRLSDALADGDHIWAVIKGSALNNDGAHKIGFTAPSVDGQAEVIALAQAQAGVDPATISYIEAHGTATPLGDPIEVAGLAKAFGTNGHTKKFCALGSVKGNLGHLDTAAGIAGLIKTVLALHHEKIPASLHFNSPNPKIDFAHSPFFVNAKLRDWPRGDAPRRAGVSSFGIGGTNAHVVLEEAPAPAASAAAARPFQLLTLSAKTPKALETATLNLAERLQHDHALNLADAAFTLHTGRKAFEHRRAIVCDSTADLAHTLHAGEARQIATGRVAEREPPVAFMFPGQGAQHVNMARGLFETEPVFREHVEAAGKILRAHLEPDLRRILFPPHGKEAAATEHLTQTAITQPALFVVEYALAQLWMSWGIRPAAMIGHSLGEYVAACLAGVFSLEDALALVAARGRLMQAQPPGAMLAVRLPEHDIAPLLGAHLSLAGLNAPGACVASGPFDAIAALEKQLVLRGTPSKRLATSHAFHSAMMDGALKPFTAALRKVKLHAPRIRCASNVTGAWLTDAQATDPRYWASHLRQTVRFADGIGTLASEPGCVLLEVGPGQTLGALARQHPMVGSQHTVVCSLGHAHEPARDSAELLGALGRVWIAGANVDWDAFHANEKRRRVPLPTYPFERKRFWIEPGAFDGQTAAVATEPEMHREETAGESPPAVAPRGDNGLAQLEKIFRDLSGVELAGRSAVTFTELGFDSLFLVQAAAAVEKTFGVHVAFRDLVGELNTLAALAAHLTPAASTISTATAPLDTVVERTTTAPLTEAQREIWFACQVGDVASCAYNESHLLRFHGAFQVEPMCRALQRLVDLHAALRTSFAALGDQQQVTETVELEIPLFDWSAEAPEARAAQLDALAAGESGQAFDLRHAPLVRARLVRLAPAEHVLLLTIHHIVCDGHSWAILLKQLAELYAAECRGAPVEIAPPLQLLDYARAQIERLASPERRAAEEFWTAQFADGAPVVELPADRPAAPPGFAGGRETRTLDKKLRESLRALCTRQGCTFFNLVLGAYYVWLARLSGQNDLVVGVPVAERTAAGTDTLVAHCVELLPVRVRTEPRAPFTALLADAKRVFLDAFEHRACGFGRILQLLNLPRDTGRLPLVAVTFNVDRLHEELAFAGIDKTELTFNPHCHTNVDLGVNLTEVGDHLVLECRYRAARFDADTIRRWLGHFEVLLEAIVAQPETRMGELPLLSADQHHRLVVEWNATRASYPAGKCVHELFEEQAARTPDATAVIDGAERVTYRELNARADTLASHLRALEVGPDTLVGICLERTTAMVAAVLAVLKAGGAYVPLDPAYPAERIAFMLEDARAPVVLTQRSLAVTLPAASTNVVCVDDPATLAAPRAKKKSTAAAQPNHLAYVLFTSGSTGRPKGVAIEHRSVVALVAWALRRYRPEELRGVLASTSLCFDLSVFELFVPLACGGAAILATNALALPALPAANEVTLINTVPSAIAELLRLHAIPPSAATLNLAGEPLAQELVEKLYQLSTVRRVFDLYGPTEDTVYSTCALRWPGGHATIGRPLENEQVYVLDAQLEPTPLGVPGELFIGGDGLARGYLNRPELTAEKFIASPFVAGARLYRTGDRVRLLPDGNLEFLGRLDHQVKVRGFRIELGEIEAQLRQHSSVGETVVIATPTQLVAYVAPAGGAAVEVAGLHRHLSARLPDYMVPAAIVVLGALPRTLNGKIDRKALPAPDASALVMGAAEFVAPSTSTEEALARMWCELLGRERVGVHDDFFLLGGHSLLATQFIVRVREAFRVELSLRQVFETPTVATLARAVEEQLVAEISAMSDAEAQRYVQTA